jgi:hypothetical protein
MTYARYALWAALAGAFVPVKAVLNARLGEALGAPTHAALVLFAVGLVATGAASLFFTRRGDDEHDPWNDESVRHPRAQQLMAAELWDCVDEDAPFGSGEGHDAYYEYRAWRADHPNAPLSVCLDRIGAESGYPDPFTFDATIIATVLGQLVDEGRIDADAKLVARRALKRQLQDANEGRRDILRKVTAAIDEA